MIIVFGIRRNIINLYDQFITQLVNGEITDFHPNPKSQKLQGFLTSLFCLCDDFMEDYENPEFYESILSGFERLQKIIMKSKPRFTLHNYFLFFFFSTKTRQFSDEF